MRAIDIHEVRNGMRIAKTIYDDAGRVLLNTGALLTSRYIDKLSSYGIPFIYIEDEILGPLEVEDVINDRVRQQTVKALKQIVDNARMKSDIDIKPISTMVNKILDDLRSVPNMMMQLMDIRSSNSFIYNHSVGVCVLSIMTGMVLGLDELKLKNLGMGAILHDIGKALSQGPEHTIHGFEILRNNKLLNIVVAHVAYQHHEKYDGTGFPRQLKGEDIHLFAAIVALADLYDNLVSNPEAEKRLFPYQALELIVAESNRAFHPEIVKAFSQNIAPYPVGSAVRLNNGAVGVVITVPKHYPTRPLIKLITSHTGILLTNFPEVDLMKEATLFVNEVLSEKERQEITAS